MTKTGAKCLNCGQEVPIDGMQNFVKMNDFLKQLKEVIKKHKNCKK